MVLSDWVSTYTDEEWLSSFSEEGSEWIDTLPTIEYNVVLHLNTIDNTYYFTTESITYYYYTKKKTYWVETDPEKYYYYTKDKTYYLETKNIRRL